jgi:putative transposase
VPQISRILNGAVKKSVKEIITRLCEWKKLEILEMNVMEDHVHLVISIPPKFAVADIIGFIKGKCAIKIFYKHLGLKKRYWNRHFWAKGYCVSTVGLDEEKICKYVKWQLAKINAWNNSRYGTKYYPFKVIFYSTPSRGGC